MTDTTTNDSESNQPLGLGCNEKLGLLPEPGVTAPAAQARPAGFRGGWDVFIGEERIGCFHEGATSWIGEHKRLPERAAAAYAARVNAELAGGVLAFGCAEERGSQAACKRWCGLPDCTVSLRPNARGQVGAEAADRSDSPGPKC